MLAMLACNNEDMNELKKGSWLHEQSSWKKFKSLEGRERERKEEDREEKKGGIFFFVVVGGLVLVYFGLVFWTSVMCSRKVYFLTLVQTYSPQVKR